MGKNNSLLTKFLNETQPKGQCAICVVTPPVSKETCDLINLAKGKGRGPVAVMDWLRKENLWPEGWSQGRIAAHWKHSK